jgi:hypothetical protein
MKKILFAVLELSVVGLVVSFCFNTNWATEQILGLRLEYAIHNINRSSFDKVITADVVAEAIGSNRYGLYSARKAMFDQYLCPVFGDKHDDQGRCFNVLYGTNAGDVSDVKYWYAKAGVPVSAEPKVVKFRAVMMSRAKAYLSKQENIRSLYLAHKGEIVSEIRKMSAPNRQALIDRLHKIGVTFLVETGQKLTEFEPDEEAQMFARRRQAELGNEGGNMVLYAYEAAMTDLRRSLEAK